MREAEGEGVGVVRKRKGRPAVCFGQGSDEVLEELGK